jgi:histidinol-phosphate aminotransferase
LAIKALDNIQQVNETIKNIVQQRNCVHDQLQQFKFIQIIYSSDANFILVKVDDADKLYKYLLMNRIIVRNRSKEPLCENCIRITIGTEEENQILINALKNYA